MSRRVAAHGAAMPALLLIAGLLLVALTLADLPAAALMLAARGDYKQAFAVAARWSAMFPQDTAFRRTYVRLLLEDLRVDEALEQLEQMRHDMPLSIWPVEQELAIEQGLLTNERVTRLLETLAEMNPKDVEMSRLLADRYRFEDQQSQYHALLSRIAKMPGGESATWELADSLLDERKHAEAIELLERAVARDVNNVRAQRQLYLAYKGTGKLESAVEQLRTLMALEPNNPEPIGDLALNQLRLGRVGESESAYHRFVNATAGFGSLTPQRRRFIVSYTSSLKKQGYADRAQRLAVSAAERWSSDTALALHAASLEPENASNRTLHILSRAARIDPKKPAMLKELADRLSRSGRHREAAQIYRKLTRLPGSTFAAHEAVAENLLWAGDTEQALSYYPKIIELNPTREHLEAFAQLQIDAGNGKDAVAVYETLIRENPAIASYRRNLVETAIGENACKAALPHMRWLVAKDPGDARMLLWLGDCATRLGETSVAREALEMLDNLSENGGAVEVQGD